MQESQNPQSDMITNVPGLVVEGSDSAVEQNQQEIISSVPGMTEVESARPANTSPEDVATAGVSQFGAAKALARLQNQANLGPNQAALAEQAGKAFDKQFGDE